MSRARKNDGAKNILIAITENVKLDMVHWFCEVTAGECKFT